MSTDPVSAALLSWAAGLPSGREARIGVAYSGGLDSTVLTHCLADLAGRGVVACRSFAVHVDHALRPEPELARERQLVVKNCLVWNVPLMLVELGLGRVTEHSAAAGVGIEESARRLRYGALEAEADRLSLDLVLTAHQRDDDLETRIMHFFRGQGGERGIPVQRGRYVRPLLALGRKDLLAYAQAHGLSWHEDSSNGGTDYLRNRIRQELLPVAARLFPGFGKALDAQKFFRGQDEAWLETQAAGLAWQFTASGSDTADVGCACASLASWRLLPFPLRWRAIRLVCEEFLRRGCLGRLPSRNFYGVAAGQADFRTGTLRRVLVDSEGLQFGCTAREVFVRPRIVDARKKGYLVHLTGNGCFTVPGLGTITVGRKPGANPEASMDLVVRSLRHGDRSPDDGRHLWRQLGSGRVPVADLPLVPLVMERGRILAVLTAPWTGQDRWFTPSGEPGLEIKYLEMAT